jgi:hypothetical protein
MRILILFLLVGSVAQAQVTEQPFSLRSTGFLSFKIHGQTLPTAIHNLNRKVKIEVAPGVDLANVVPSFEVSEGDSVYVDGVQQISGITAVDFSKEVTYQIKNNGNAQTTIWTASAIPLSCRILIDVSHDGGSWSSPQPSTHFDQNQRHQGKAFADLLRSKGFEVNELGAPLTEEMFFGHYIVIRAGGFHTYTPEELKVYASLLDRGMNLVFLTGPKKNSPVDELGERLGIRFEGVASGRVTTFASDELTKNLISIGGYNGSALTNLDSNPNIKVLGWLGSTDFGDINMNSVKDPKEQTAPPVMGVLTYSKSKVFFIGDTVAIQTTPQPFVDNLVKWMLGSCFESGLRP